MSASQIHTLSFDSVSQLGRFVRDTPRVSTAPDSSEKTSDGPSWDHGMDYTTAVNTACKGGMWQEGADKMRKALAITSDLVESKPLPQLTTSPDGFMPCVPHALMNLPNTMFKLPKVEGIDKPVIRIGVQMGIYWATTAEEQIRKGAAILSVIDQLEEQGFRCELVCLWRASDTNDNAFSKWVNIECTIKQPDEHWNPVSAAFMIAHPAAIRRVMWKAAETQTQYLNAIRCGYCTNKNTGKLADSMDDDFDVWFPCIADAERKHLKNEESALDWVQKRVLNQLKKVDNETH